MQRDEERPIDFGMSLELPKTPNDVNYVKKLITQILYLQTLVSEQQKKIESSTLEVQKKKDQIRELERIYEMNPKSFLTLRRTPALKLLPETLSVELSNEVNLTSSTTSSCVKPSPYLTNCNLKNKDTFPVSKNNCSLSSGIFTNSNGTNNCFSTHPKSLDDAKDNVVPKKLNDTDQFPLWSKNETIDPIDLGYSFISPFSMSFASKGNEILDPGESTNKNLFYEFPNGTTEPFEKNSVHSGKETLQYSATISKWKAMIEQIIFQNDQAASLSLQQQLKNEDIEDNINLINTILPFSVTLMKNKFGNFLIQKCFEYSTEAQLQSFSYFLKKHVKELSIDAFGSHVLQKSLEIYPERFTNNLIEELIECLPATLMQRHSCHVWQKFFETRRKSLVDGIFDHFNKKMQGKWLQVSVSEMGSLVVQTIFENCKEKDKVRLNVIKHELTNH